jgi:auxin-responsive protein IAA
LELTRGFVLSVRVVRAQVVGWPPVRSFRKNALADVAAAGSARPAKFVKVAVDGAPYLRKVNLQDYAGYDSLIRAFQDKFCSHFTISEYLNPPLGVRLLDGLS